MSSPLADKIQLAPAFSKQLAILLATIHIVTFIVIILIFPLTLPPIIKICLTVWIAISAYYTTQRHLFYKNHPLYQSYLSGDGLELKNGETAIIQSNTYINPQLIVLVAKLNNGQTTSLIILPDAMDPQTFRRLRVRLRHSLI